MDSHEHTNNFSPQRLRENLIQARIKAGVNQPTLAHRCEISQQQISGIELGTLLPTLGQILRISQALDVSIQFLLRGSNQPGNSYRELAIELRHLGMVDLWVEDAIVPGAFRAPEEVINRVLAEASPDPRILEAVPALLAWVELDHRLLAAHASILETTRRLGWLTSLTIALARQHAFPGGCRRTQLEQYLASTEASRSWDDWDGLGKPSETIPKLPIWKRWRVNYDAKPTQFLERAESLFDLRSPRRPSYGGLRRRVKQAGSPPVKLPTDDTPSPAAQDTIKRRRQDDGET